MQDVLSSSQTLLVSVASCSQSAFLRALANPPGRLQLPRMDPILSLCLPPSSVSSAVTCNPQPGEGVHCFQRYCDQRQHLHFVQSATHTCSYTQFWFCSLLFWVPIKLESYIHLGGFAGKTCFSVLIFPPGLWIMKRDIWPFDSKTFRPSKGRAVSREELEYLWHQSVETKVSWEGM